MPKTTTADVFQITLRLSTKVAAWLKNLSETRRESVNDLLRQVVDDAHSLYGLPMTIVQALDDDAKALGMERRDYLMHLLALRYNQIVREGVGFEKKHDKKR